MAFCHFSATHKAAGWVLTQIVGHSYTEMTSRVSRTSFDYGSSHYSIVKVRLPLPNKKPTLTCVSVGTDTASRLRRRWGEMLLTSQVSVTSWFFSVCVGILHWFRTLSLCVRAQWYSG
jgi:hypothetical protein